MRTCPSSSGTIYLLSIVIAFGHHAYSKSCTSSSKITANCAGADFFSGFSMRSTRPSLTRKLRAWDIFWDVTSKRAAISLLVCGSPRLARALNTSSRKLTTSWFTRGLRSRVAAFSSCASFLSQNSTTSGSSAITALMRL